MSVSLTTRQKDELHKAILEYLHSADFPKTCAQFKEEEGSLAEFKPENAKNADLLVKKWTSIIRLQKKILDLEARLAQALEENACAGPSASKRTSVDWLPVNGAKHELTGHRERVNCVAFHPVYSILCSASDDATLKIWDWELGEFERTLKGHTKRVTDCQYDSKGKMLVSASYDVTAKLWDVDNRYQNVATLRGHEHSVSSARFLPGDARVITASRDETVRIWEVASSHCVKVIRAQAAWIRSAVANSDGRFIVTSSSNHTALVLDAETGAVKAEMRGHEHVVEAAMFVPPNAVPAVRELVGHANAPVVPGTASHLYVATASRDKTMKLWDAQSGNCLWTFIGHDNWVNDLIFHPAGKHIISASDDRTYRIWEIKTGRCVRRIEAHAQFVTSLAWGRQALGVEHDKAAGGKADQAPVARVVNVLATCSTDKTIRIWLP